MGAYSPASIMPPMMVDLVMATIIRPTLAAMASRGTPFKGVLYAGLMLTPEGPKLIEYNARFGDPETQVLIPRLKSDIVPLLMASADGQLAHVDARWDDRAAVTVVVASEGYPGPVTKGSVIRGIDAAETTGALVFHAGTARNAAGEITANGGRVLNVTALGANVTAARDAAYAAIAKLDWPQGFCRRDIAWREIEREKA
jgi:phosphoribosylamine--glycine ligase